MQSRIYSLSYVQWELSLFIHLGASSTFASSDNLSEKMDGPIFPGKYGFIVKALDYKGNEVVSEVLNAKVVFDNLNKNLDSSGQSVTTPINGFVKQLFVQNGQYVEAGQPIITISQNETLLLRAEVRQKYASILGAVNSANIRTLYNNQTYSLEQLSGKILSFGKSTNNDNYLVPVSLQIENNGDFVSGSFVELFLKTLTNTQALTIPNSALLEEQGIFFVFVQITPELFEKREVKTGATDGLKTEIIKGLIHHERVVSKGAILIKLAQVTGTLDAHSGHVH